jgi:hypothetical protein
MEEGKEKRREEGGRERTVGRSLRVAEKEGVEETEGRRGGEGRVDGILYSRECEYLLHSIPLPPVGLSVCTLNSYQCVCLPLLRPALSYRALSYSYPSLSCPITRWASVR